MKLIREEIEKVKVITEGTGKSTRLYIKGPFLKEELGILNGRSYPMPIMERK